jgi:hypothetical protein
LAKPRLRRELHFFVIPFDSISNLIPSSVIEIITLQPDRPDFGWRRTTLRLNLAYCGNRLLGGNFGYFIIIREFHSDSITSSASESLDYRQTERIFE